MGLPSGDDDHARHRHEPDFGTDPGQAPTRLCTGRDRRAADRLTGTLFAILISLVAGSATADPIRIATFHTELERKGPGLLLRAILSDEDPQVRAVARVVRRVTPDILLLQGIDYDHGLAALQALRDVIAQDGGPRYPHLFALRPNTGRPTGFDMDGNDRRGEARDRQGFGLFSGQGGMAILSRFPVSRDTVRDFSALKWEAFPGALLPEKSGAPFPSAAAQAALRLSSVAHWVVPIRHPAGDLSLLAFHAGPPVFDGPQDRNGRRNHDQILFWRHMLDGAFGQPPAGRFVIMGIANLDPIDGEGRKAAIHALLDDPRLQDPRPMRPGPVPPDPPHAGDPRLDTVRWPAPGPGALRVDYVLPSRDWRVLGSGVHWPTPGTPGAADARTASRHRLVWVDLHPETGR